MANTKLLPKQQMFLDLRDGNQVSVTRVILTGDTTNHVVLPNTVVDAQLLANTVGGSNPSFYVGALGGTSSKRNQVNIDGGTTGAEAFIVARHQGMVNFGSE